MNAAEPRSVTLSAATVEDLRHRIVCCLDLSRTPQERLDACMRLVGRLQHHLFGPEQGEAEQ